MNGRVWRAGSMARAKAAARWRKRGHDGPRMRPAEDGGPVGADREIGNGHLRGYLGQVRAVVRARRYEASTQGTTESAILPYHDFCFMMEQDGTPVSDPPTWDEVEFYVVFLWCIFWAATASKRLRATSVDTYMGCLARDLSMRHRGFNLWKEYTTVRGLINGIKKFGAEAGEKPDEYQPLTPSEMAMMVEWFMKESKESKDKRGKWNSFVMSVLVVTMWMFLMRVGEVSETRYNRDSELGGLCLGHVLFLTEEHEVVPLDELEARQAEVRWAQISWEKTKMDQLARGEVRSHYVSGMRLCVVGLLVRLVVKMVSAGAGPRTPVFCTFDMLPFPDYLLRRKWKHGATGCGLSKNKGRPHRGGRSGGNVALTTAGVDEKFANWFGRWTPDSKTAPRVYGRVMRSSMKSLQRVMLAADVRNEIMTRR